MSPTRMALRIRPYDHVAPLLLREVETPGLVLDVDRMGPLAIIFPETLDAAEVSFNRYVLAHARGEDTPLGIPAYILRGFRHRNVFVRRDSRLRTLADLRGRRLGTNSWSDTGTLWARAAMRDAGVNARDVTWVVGPLDDQMPSRTPAPGDLVPPEDAERLAPGDTLLAALERGHIDALTTAFAPLDVFRAGGAIRRLVEDYEDAERAYHGRTGIYPVFHIVAVRQDYAQSHPQAVVDLYRALRQSWDAWWIKATRFAEASPWAMVDLERLARDFAGDTPPFGLSSPAHKRVLAAICEEQFAQGLVDAPAEPDRLFAPFLALLDRLGLSEDTLLDDLPPPASARRLL